MDEYPTAPGAYAHHAFEVADRVGIDLDTVIVFGSVVVGAADMDSDVDLVLVSPDFEDVSFVERGTDFDWMWDRAYRTPDITPLTPDEFGRRATESDDIVATAVRTGVRFDTQPTL